MSIVIRAINDGPVAFSQPLTNAEDTLLPITLTGSDVDRPVTNFTVISLPANGVLTGTAPNLSYLPGTNYVGGDSFTFVVDDGSLTSTVATVSIVITAINDEPVADLDDMLAALERRQPGDSVALTLWRNGQTRKQSVVLTSGE